MLIYPAIIIGWGGGREGPKLIFSISGERTAFVRSFGGEGKDIGLLVFYMCTTEKAQKGPFLSIPKGEEEKKKRERERINECGKSSSSLVRRLTSISQGEIRAREGG